MAARTMPMSNHSSLERDLARCLGSTSFVMLKPSLTLPMAILKDH